MDDDKAHNENKPPYQIGDVVYVIFNNYTHNKIKKGPIVAQGIITGYATVTTRLPVPRAENALSRLQRPSRQYMGAGAYSGMCGCIKVVGRGYEVACVLTPKKDKTAPEITTDAFLLLDVFHSRRDAENECKVRVERWKNFERKTYTTGRRKFPEARPN